MKKTIFAASLLLLASGPGEAQDRDAKACNDRQSFGASMDWVYNQGDCAMMGNLGG